MYHYCVMHVHDPRLAATLHWLKFSSKAGMLDSPLGRLDSCCLHIYTIDKSLIEIMKETTFAQKGC